MGFKSCMLYPNLEGELYKNNITYKELAKELGITDRTLYNKLTGKTELSISDAKIICAFLEKRSRRAQSLKHLFNIN